jgi:hypothetical protein
VSASSTMLPARRSSRSTGISRAYNIVDDDPRDHLRVAARARVVEEAERTRAGSGLGRQRGVVERGFAHLHVPAPENPLRARPGHPHSISHTGLPLLATTTVIFGKTFLA